MDVVVGFGLSFFFSAVVVMVVFVAEITSANKNEHKTGPDSLWIGPCFQSLPALAVFLSGPYIWALIATPLYGITCLLSLHALIINFVHCVSIYN